MQKTVLAIFAHPDDAELTCFGTLSILSRKNFQVIICIVTEGETGLAPNEVNERRQEAQIAADMIGAKLEFGGFPDGYVAHDTDLISTIETWVNLYQPEIVITHAPEPRRAGHQDHLSVSSAVSNTVSRIRSCRMLLFAEPPKPSQHFMPNLIVDISSHAEIKRQAIEAHHSQVKKWYFNSDTVALRSKWWQSNYTQNLEQNETDSDVRLEAFQIDRLLVSDNVFQII